MKTAKRIISVLMAALIVLSCWVWLAPDNTVVSEAATQAKDHYLFAYFTGTSKDGQTIHLAVSEDGYNYTALRDNEPVIIPSKGVGNVRDPYIWYNEQDNYYYILATDLDFTDANNSWGANDYSNNSESFIIWRSKDLVNWYDETFIDVNAMAHLIGNTNGMNAVWAPQVLWDGSAYVVYFTLRCNATSGFDLVYLKTTDLLNQDAYYEFGYLLDNGGYDRIDADIVYNDYNDKWYLFYKTETNGGELGTTPNNTSLKTIHFYTGDSPTGPFSNADFGDNKWSGVGWSVFPDYNVSLEGGNTFFDNNGNLVMLADEFEHTNPYTNEAEAYFHIATTPANSDFKSWTYKTTGHNINSLSPRHGSVVKITEAEYNRLLNNSWNITSSSYPATETLEDHLVARFFSNDNPADNAVVGQPDLAATDIDMINNPSYGWYANFNGTSSYAEIDFDSLFLKTKGLNYNDGFTITFNALNTARTGFNNNEVNDRIFEIADTHASRTGTEHYTHFSPGGGGSGSYLGNYNGPVDGSTYDWLNDKDFSNRYDGNIHEYIISYANGNVMVYVDGELVISRNRFYKLGINGTAPAYGGATLDDSWFKALGSNSTMLIGKSNWPGDPLYLGAIQDFCIYDCSMSYYDAKSLSEKVNVDNGWSEPENYNGVNCDIPTFANASESQMSTQNTSNGMTYVPSEHFGNILYTTPVTGTPSGSGTGANPTNTEALKAASATYADLGTNNNFKFGIYYSHFTVLLYDGVNPARMPVMLAGRINTNNYAAYLNGVYPTEIGSNTENNDLKLEHEWRGWNSTDSYYETINNPDGTSYRIGYNPSTIGNYQAYFQTGSSQSARKVNYYASTLAVDGDNIDFGDAGYKKYNLHWRIKGEAGSDTFDVRAIAKNSTIYVINFKPIVDLRNSITQEEYNKVMGNSALCPELREKYAAAVKDIMTLDPDNFGFQNKAEAAALTATKACAAAVTNAVSTYEGVIAEIAREEAAGTYGHQKANFDAREATCSQNGLTSGSYCFICGEILEEQQIIAPLPHSFGAVFTENGVQYRECTECGVRIKYEPSEVRYENLFSFNRWNASASNNVFNGTISTNVANGEITIVNQNDSEIYTRTTYDGQNLVATRDFGCYCIPVTGGKTYVVEATSLASSTSNGDVFVMQFNKNGLAFSAIPAVISNLTPDETRNLEFTVDANAAYIELRFDANDAGKTITFSQIGVYRKEGFAPFGATTADARLGFNPGDSKKLCHPNTAAGYVFDGWYTSNGARVENVNQLNNPSTIVYGKWIEAGYNVVYDSIFSFSDWAKSSSNQLWYGDSKDANGNVTRLVSDEGILADAENGTITIHNDEDTTYFARTNYWVDNGNVHQMKIEQNTDYVIEYTASSTDGAKPSICAYITGGTAQYPESGNQTSYGLGTQYFRFNSGNNTKLSIRFDNVQHGSTVTYSNIAVYKESLADRPEYFADHAHNITNRQYMRYYPTEMGIGNVYDYTPTRPGYTFENWWADVDGTIDGNADYDCKNLPDSFVVNQNWHLFSTWTENSYNIAYNANNGSGTVEGTNQKYTQNVTLASEGFTRAGYKLIGWSTIPTATVAQYQLGQTTSRLTGDNNGTVTLYAVWVKSDINVTFDNLIDFTQWTKIAGNGTVSDVTGTGMTITSKDGVSESTSTSHLFPVTAGKNYRIDIDITGSNWDVYIFFYDSNTSSGLGLEFADGPTRRFSSGTTHEPVFTAPSGATRAVIRVDANGISKGTDSNGVKLYDSNTVRFENIRVYEDTGVTVSPVNKIVSYGTAFGELPTPERADYNFAGWFDANGNKITSSTTVTQESTVNLFSRWLITDSALNADVIVVDFGTPVEFDTFANDAGFKKELAAESAATYKLLGFSTNGTSTPATTLPGSYGSFAVNNLNVTYTPSGIMNGTDTVYYHVELTTNAGTTTVKSQITVAPASNVFYEEDIFTMGTATGVAWSTVTDADAVKAGKQSASTNDDVYGFDSSYNNVADYSNGTAYKAVVDSQNKRSKIASFSFDGSGFQLNGACGPDTGIQIVTLKNNDTGKMVKSYIVDTYYGDADYGTLYQVPVITALDLGYANYSVQVMASYLSMAGALNATVSTQAVPGFDGMTAYSAEGTEELADMLAAQGIELADDVEVIWFDDNSLFNGGKGTDTQVEGTISTASDVTSLLNVIDSVRIYNPLDGNSEYYNDGEADAQYYNVMANLVNGNGSITDGSEEGNFAYISGNDNEEISIETYDAFGSKDELYLSGATTAVTFTIENFVDGESKVMVSLRAASGTPDAKFGNKQFTVKSNTEMYYDITEYVSSTGTVTIQNPVSDSLLAIGTVKLVGGGIPTQSVFNLDEARTMMLANASYVEPNAPATDSDFVGPVQPDTDEVPEDDTTETNKLSAFFDMLMSFLDKIVAFVKNIVNSVAGLLKF